MNSRTPGGKESIGMDMGAMRFAFGHVGARKCGMDSEYSFLCHMDV